MTSISGQASYLLGRSIVRGSKFITVDLRVNLYAAAYCCYPALPTNTEPFSLLNQASLKAMLAGGSIINSLYNFRLIAVEEAECISGSYNEIPCQIFNNYLHLLG